LVGSFIVVLKVMVNQAWWYTSLIPATQETEISRIAVQGKPGQKVSKTLISMKKTRHRGMDLSSQLHGKLR
jgi:hypothetical protein